MTDEQFQFMFDRFIELKQDIRLIENLLFNKLKVNKIILIRDSVRENLQIQEIIETPDGNIIKVI